MSRDTLKLIDLYCAASNWQGSIDGLPSDAESTGMPAEWIEEIKQERREWGRKRDKIIQSMKVILSRLTDQEKQLLIRRANADLDKGFLRLGIDISAWWINRNDL